MTACNEYFIAFEKNCFLFLITAFRTILASHFAFLVYSIGLNIRLSFGL